LLELKTKTVVQEVPMQFTLTAPKTAAYNGIEEEFRPRIAREIKMETQALRFNLISGFRLMAGFKAKINIVLSTLNYFQIFLLWIEGGRGQVYLKIF
jgi:hypothetical protein